MRVFITVKFIYADGAAAHDDNDNIDHGRITMTLVFFE